MTLITLSVFWKGIVIGFCFGFCIALLSLGALCLLPIQRQDKRDSRQCAADNAQPGI